ncbi:MAG: ABC transporter substrate-binding protein [Actinomycetota bacterium]
MSDKRRPGGAWSAAAIVIAMSLLSAFTARIPHSTSATSASDPLGSNGLTGPTSRSVKASPGATIGTQTVPQGLVQGPGGKTYDCSKGQNAGDTEVGVSRTQITFAATVVKTGIAKDFLSDAQTGMDAVIAKTNRAGGICGRTIKVVYADDGWDPETGQRQIKTWIEQKLYFGLAVNPSSEGVRGAIDSHLIRDNQFPVIGSDGQLIDQYQDPWVWPVATSTSSVMHIMAHDAFNRGARNVGIVYDGNYRFGVEGEAAFVGAMHRLGVPDTNIVEEKVQGGQQSYLNQVNDFIGRCGGTKLTKCQFIAMLLEPATATRWVGDGGLGNGTDRPSVGIGAPQPLFVQSFATDCGKYCDGMYVWTSFNPPINSLANLPDVATYQADLGQVTSSDNVRNIEDNPHVEGAYVGMELLVQALRLLGPAPTRLGMQSVLNSLTFQTGLAPTLRFSASSHYANVSAQAFSILTQGGSFSGWRQVSAQNSFVSDPEAGMDVPPSS